MLSVFVAVSENNANVGVATSVSKLKVNFGLIRLILPATSVCLTIIAFSPSPVMPVIVVPVPFNQLMPASRLYCHVAPVSIPEIVIAAFLVILSVATFVSVVRAMLGATTVLSNVKVIAELAVLIFPAKSVCRAVTDFAPSEVSAKLSPLPEVQEFPASRLYSHVAPFSNPETVILPLLVILSLAAVSVNAKLGALTLVSIIKFNGVLWVLVFPATSFCSTMTDFLPSPVNSNVVVLAAVHELQFTPLFEL